MRSVTPAVSMGAVLKPYSLQKRTFKSLLILNAVLLPLAMVTFGDRFDFWRLPLSDLGTVTTRMGTPNHLSMILFSLNMIAGSAIMLAFARSQVRCAALPHKRAKVALAGIAAGGFLLGITPHNVVHGLHTAGCAAMIGSLWALAVVLSVELRALERIHEAAVVQLTLQATILPYAAAYFLGSDVKQVLQKFAIAGLFLSLSLAARFLRQAVLEHLTRGVGQFTGAKNLLARAG